MKRRSRATSTGEPTIRVLEYYRDMRKKIIGLGILAGFSAQLQATTIIGVVLLAQNLAAKHKHFNGTIGHLHIKIANEKLIEISAIALVIALILNTLTTWIKSRMVTDWDYDHREQVIGEYLRADYPTQSAERLGTLGLLTGYVQRGSGLLSALAGGLIAAISLSVYVAYAVLVDPRAAVLMISAVIFMAIALRPVMKKIKLYSKAQSQLMIDYNRDVTEATRMVRDLRVFDALTPLGANLTTSSRRLTHLRQRASFVNSMVSTLYQYAGMFIVLGVLTLGAAGTIDVVKVGIIALLLIRSMSYGSGLQATYQNVIDGIPYLERLEAMRATYLAHRTHDGAHVVESVKTLKLDALTYSYDGKVDAVARVSAEFRVGEIIGIVGPSGGGKSTLSQLLLRLREPTSGAIRIDGESAREFKLSSWYRNVSLVPQDPRLFHATVAANIALLDRKLTREQIIDAAKAAGIHDVIEELDNGYDTRIGPAFRDLSGGQIQRIGIARALARGAKILVLDEPTSALDVHSEAIIQSTLEQLRAKALVIIIAHRLSTLSICDRIMVMRNGSVETLGTLAEAAEQSEFFRRALEAGTLEITIDGAAPGADVTPDGV